MKRTINVIVAIVSIFVIMILIMNYMAINVENNDEVSAIITQYLNAGEDLEVIDMKKDGHELFIIYSDRNTPIALCILQETFLSFGKYYTKFGGSSGGLSGDYILTEGSSGKYKKLLVAYGLVKELKDNSYIRYIGSQKEVITHDETDKYFLDIFRMVTDKDIIIRVDYNEGAI